MKYYYYIAGLIALLGCFIGYRRRKIVERRDSGIEFRPGVDAAGDELEFVIRKRDSQ